MFTGLVEGIGTVVDARNASGEMDLRVDLGALGAGVAVGDSVALSGACCTVTRVEGTTARFWLTAETLARTWFGPVHGKLAAGRKLNLERSLRAGQPMGGHIVQGHVDGVGRILHQVGRQGGNLVVEVPEPLLRYCVEKGSIALDGVSLTIAGLAGAALTMAIVPHTAVHTTLGGLGAGEPLNVEVDVLAKYVERLLAAHRSVPGTAAGSALPP